MAKLLGRLRPGGPAIKAPRLFLLLLVIPLSFVVGAEAPYVEASHAGDPSVVGHWDEPFTTPIVGIHAVVLRTGKVLLVQGIENSDQGGKAVLWNPLATSDEEPFVEIPPPDNLFCLKKTFSL